jgi:molecular chaperone GrpE
MSSSPEESSTGPVIRDLRRIDPRTGQVRNPGADAQGAAARGPGKPARPGKHSAARPGGAPGSGAEAPGHPGAAAPAPGGAAPAGPGEGAAAGGAPGAAAPEPDGAPGSGLAAQLAERTADLQRVSAEYANYRKRVDRDRLVVREQSLANVLVALLPVLDDIGRARDHGELVGGFEKVAQSLESIVTKLGLVSFGTEGEPFDPNVHEAVSLTQAAGVTEPTCVQILQPGYKVGERIVRPARVIVAEPGDDAATAGQPDEAGPDGAGSQESREDED